MSTTITELGNFVDLMGDACFISSSVICEFNPTENLKDGEYTDISIYDMDCKYHRVYLRMTSRCKFLLSTSGGDIEITDIPVNVIYLSETTIDKIIALYREKGLKIPDDIKRAKDNRIKTYSLFNYMTDFCFTNITETIDNYEKDLKIKQLETELANYKCGNIEVVKKKASNIDHDREEKKAKRKPAGRPSKFSDTDIKIIHELNRLGYSLREIASQMNCSKSTIDNILNKNISGE